MGEAPHILELAELDIDDGPELARLVTRVRALAAQHGAVQIRDCPQLLAHTLYKTGDLRDGRIELCSVREEEPYG
ncbi:MAG: hypothetical protein K0V04_36740 [Deltaproteobacteria bacterium]|nr:hypothetical protein [Deltaproteobacteria bacterium]